MVTITTDDVVQKFGGAWAEDKLSMLGKDGYVWIVATKDAAGVVSVTRDGARLGVCVDGAPPIGVKYSASKPSKRAKDQQKQQPQVKVEEEPREFELPNLED